MCKADQAAGIDLTWPCDLQHLGSEPEDWMIQSHSHSGCNIHSAFQLHDNLKISIFADCLMEELVKHGVLPNGFDIKLSFS